jgi:type IV pilus assembly protein PilM
MSILSGVSDFFGLDIGTSNIRLVQLGGGGKVHALIKYAMTPIDDKISLSDSDADQQKLMAVVKELIDTAGVATKNVAVGIPSQRVFTTVVDMDRLPQNELEKSISYQADSLIPTPLAESKLDWQVIGDSPSDKNKLELLIILLKKD